MCDSACSEEVAKGWEIPRVAVNLCGWVGAALLLLAYALASARVLPPQGGRFQALNIIGSAGLAINGAAHAAWPSVVLNMVWMVIGAAAVALAASRFRHGRRRVPAQTPGDPPASATDRAGSAAAWSSSRSTYHEISSSQPPYNSIDSSSTAPETHRSW